MSSLQIRGARTTQALRFGSRSLVLSSSQASLCAKTRTACQYSRKQKCTATRHRTLFASPKVPLSESLDRCPADATASGKAVRRPARRCCCTPNRTAHWIVVPRPARRCCCAPSCAVARNAVLLPAKLYRCPPSCTVARNAVLLPAKLYRCSHRGPAAHRAVLLHAKLYCCTPSGTSTGNSVLRPFPFARLPARQDGR